MGSKITADGDCSHEIRRHLLLRRKAMANLGSILKSRGIILPTEVHTVKTVIVQWSCMDERAGPSCMDVRVGPSCMDARAGP